MLSGAAFAASVIAVSLKLKRDPNTCANDKEKSHSHKCAGATTPSIKNNEGVTAKQRSDSPQDPVQQQLAASTKQMAVATKRLACFNGILMGANLLMVLFIGIQAKAALSQMRAYKVAEAASVTVQKLTLDLSERTGGSVLMWLGNNGKISAGAVSVAAQVSIYGTPIDPVITRNAAFSFGNDGVHPGRSDFPFRMLLNIGDQELRALRAGNRAILMTGKVKYQDGFSKWVDFGMCFYYDAGRSIEWSRCRAWDSEDEPEALRRQLTELQQDHKAGSRR